MTRLARLAAKTPVHVPAAVLLQRACACAGGSGSCGGSCESDEEKRKLQRRSTDGSSVATASPIVHEVLRSSGQPLDGTTRGFMEQRLGHDFGGIRIHADARAAESAAAVHSLAFTVGQDIVFGGGQYAPRTEGGLRLLAHELTHTVQQRGVASPGAMQHESELPVGEPDDALEREADSVAADVMGTTEAPASPQQRPSQALVSRWASCGTTEQCPTRDPGERTRAHGAHLHLDPAAIPPNSVVLSFDIGSDDVASLGSDPAWVSFLASITASNDRWEILGFTDCEGGAEGNTELRRRRAANVQNAMPAAARAKVDRIGAAAMTDCVSTNGTEAGRSLNRSAVFQRTVTNIDLPEVVVTAIACPPHTTTAVTTLSDYVSLLMCAERQMHLTPREMLTMFRQLYYGKPWSSVSTTDKWDNVITCAPNVGNPEARLGTTLYQKLRNSFEVEGVDVGHVFTGLESMTCPSPNVQFAWGLGQVDMSNEEFATWGGDLGAAVAASVACPQIGAEAATSEDCGGRSGTQPLSFYIGVHAPDQDLEGDIDSYVLRAQQLGIPCSGSPQRAFTPTRPMSEVFNEYYSDPTSALGTAHTNRYLCALQAMGAVMGGHTITNRSALTTTISRRVFSFADAFYVKIQGGAAPWNLSDVGDRTAMRIRAVPVTDWFLTWLTSKL